MAQQGAKFAIDTSIVNRYRVLRLIARGGMGEKYEVEDGKTKRHLALKVLPGDVFVSDPEWSRRFKNECEAIGKVNSEHIAHVLDNGTFEDIAFIVTELIAGTDLQSIVENYPDGLPHADVLKYLEQAARGLKRLHEAGIIHRDLKPANLMVTSRDDGSPLVKIIDFGIVKIQRPGQPPEPTMGDLGTLAYMAPETRRNGIITHLADIYALGVIAFKLLNGHHFDPSLDDNPSPFLDWYRHATAERPEDRFENAESAVAALAVALEVAQHAHTHATQTAPYPNLNGTWGGELISNWEDPATKRKLDPIAIFMVVSQSGNDLKIRMLSSESRSTSLTCQVQGNDGRWSIHGTYINEPKALVRDRSPIHNGGIKLELGGKPLTILTGHYWTDRNTKGEMNLRFISREMASDFAAARSLAESALAQ